MMDDLYTTKEAAELLRSSVRTLERFRQDGVGPYFIRQGGLIFYRLIDLKQWQLDNHQI